MGRMQRIGNVFTSSVSPDGTTWTQVGTTTISMSGQVYAGMAVTSHSDGTLSTAIFDNVTNNYTSNADSNRNISKSVTAQSVLVQLSS